MDESGSPGRRVVRAGVLACGLVIVGLLAASLMVSAVPCQAEGWGCLGQGLLVGALVLLVAAVAAWPLLRAVGVRPALPVALLGFCATVALAYALGQAPMDRAGLPGLPLAAVLGYGAAALVCTRGVHWILRIVVAGLVVAAVPAADAVEARYTENGAARQFTELGFSLLAPDLPGHHVVDASADTLGGTLRYGLLPDALPANASDFERATKMISVTVRRVPSGFAPPRRCNWDSYPDDLPCVPAGDGLWRQAPDEREIRYLAVRDGLLTLLSQTSDPPDDALLRRAATTLTPQPPGHFT